MTTAELLDILIAFGWLALGLVFLREIIAERRLIDWLTLGAAFCTVRALELAVGTFDIGPDQLSVALQAAALGVLLALVFGAGRMRQLLVARHEAAKRAEHQFGEALLQYTQLVRHRIANPLTAVIGGIQTLRELELSPNVKNELLDAMEDKARELENVALHPERVDVVEQGIGPQPAPLRSPRVAGMVEAEAAQVEADFRDLNRALLSHVPAGTRTLSFLCECSAPECSQQFDMPLYDYFEVHDNPRQFVVAPGHNIPAIERLVREQDNWWVVEKTEQVARHIAEARD
jgi:signal transduction histidine kinase